MNTLKLLALLTLALPSLQQAQEHNEPEQNQTATEHLTDTDNDQHANKSFSPSSPSIDLTGNLQTLAGNQIKIILGKLRVQNIQLLGALAKNNDLLLQSLNSPTNQTDSLDTRTLLITSKEILSFITALNTYITQATNQINQNQ